jgi:shikimate kinase
MKPENVFLIGPMGAGKTTIGRQLAKVLDFAFYDSDREVEARTGVDIPTIFEYEGEEGFRKREQSMILDLAQLDHIVLATGGGAILREENRVCLAAHGFVVYLRCSIDRLVERTRRDTHRPLLDTPDPTQQLEILMRIREPLYRSCADYTVDTGQLSSRNAVRVIVNAFHLYALRQARPL